MTVPENGRVSSDELAEKIRARADSQQAVETTLATSERIIARVTDGIYREPWAAFRELVVNAYDADASYVVIETGQPDFHRMVVRDDGIGMSPQALAYVITHIGGSAKRTETGVTLNTVKRNAPDLSPGGRRLIGKIGIGLFAVAQLTQHFQIITKARGERHRLSATVHLNTHDEEQLQTGVNYVAGNVKIVSQRVPTKEKASHGTSVVLYDLRDEVRKTLQSAKLWDAVAVATDGEDAVQKPPQFHIGYSSSQDSKEPNLPWNNSHLPPEKFDQFFEAIRTENNRSTKSANLDHFDEYLRLIWKLSLSLPLEYINDHPFDAKEYDGIRFLGMRHAKADDITLDKAESIRHRLRLRAGQEKSKRDRFSVILDGIALRRPIELRHELVKDSRVGSPVMIVAKQDNPFSDTNLGRAGGRLSFEAYLYWNSQIIPKETAGVLIRIREASGTLFDPTFLNYRVSEQTRLRQITAEIFVREGLDGAINIDRESFNYSHPHFLYIQKWLHRALRLMANRLKFIAAKDIARTKAKLRDKALRHAISVWNRRFGEHVDPPFTQPPAGTLPVSVGTVDLEWPSGTILTAKGKPAGSVRIHALTAILEAYGVLSKLSIEERGQLIADIVAIPETDA